MRRLYPVKEETAIVIIVRMCAVLAALGAICSSAYALPGCVAHGNADTDFTWLLCPNGRKFERQYRYWGIWSEYYPIAADQGACKWRAPRWECTGKTYVCTPSSCS